MANFTTVFDLTQSALNRAGELQDGTSPYQADAVKYLNQIQLSVLAGSNEFDIDLGEPWSWGKSNYPGVIQLEVPYETGTVSLAFGSTSGTFSSAPSTSLAGWYLKVTDRPEYFRIATHTAAATAFTIDAAYTDSTGGTLGFKAIKLDYDLPEGVLRLVGPLRVYRAQDFDGDVEGSIYGIDEAAFNKRFPFNLLDEGIPTFFTEAQETNTGKKRLRINKYPDVVTRVEFDYIPFPQDLFNYVFSDTDVSTGGDTITIASHGIANGTVVYLDNAQGSLPGNLTKNTAFYVVNASANTLQLSLTLGGGAVDITTASGGGQHFIFNVPIVPREFRPGLEYAVSFWLMMDKNDARAPGLGELTKAKLMAMVKAHRKEGNHVAKDRGRLIPRLEQVSQNDLLLRHR